MDELITQIDAEDSAHNNFIKDKAVFFGVDVDEEQELASR